MTNDEIINKKKGFEEWLEWCQGNQRGLYKIGWAIIEKYNIQEEVVKFKKKRQTRLNREYQRTYRESHREELNKYKREYNQRPERKRINKLYPKTLKAKITRRRRERIKCLLYQRYLKRLKEKQNER